MNAKPQSSSSNVARLVFGIVVVIIGFFAVRSYGDPAPFGAALPEVPCMIETEGVDQNYISVIENRMGWRMVPMLAPQPDGVVPLRYTFNPSGGDFTINHPSGTDMITSGREQFFETNILAQGKVEFDQPVRSIRYSLPPLKEDETHAVFVSRLRHEMDRQGIRFHGGQEKLELADYYFDILEFTQSNEDGEDAYHFFFIGPFGTRALIIDFYSSVDHIDWARRYAYKIANTFTPGKELKEVLRKRAEQQELAEAVPGEE